MATGTPERGGAPYTALRGEAGYPGSLLDLEDAPLRVHVRGVLPAFDRSAAIVGSRAATPYGLGIARRLAADLARLGIPVVSGLARGIDTAAHEGALEAGGVTVAVLPFRLGAIPKSARPLAERVAARGALLTELGAGMQPLKNVFLERNRLIAALATVTVVVEAAVRSGALSTANAARRLSRPLLAVPGDLDRPTSEGANRLLRSGAGFCTSAADVVAAMGSRVAVAAAPPAPGTGRMATPAAPGTSLEDRICLRLAAGECSTDTLVRALDAGSGDVLAALLTLELAGMVEARPGQRWRSRT